MADNNEPRFSRRKSALSILPVNASPSRPELRTLTAALYPGAQWADRIEDSAQGSAFMRPITSARKIAMAGGLDCSCWLLSDAANFGRPPSYDKRNPI